MQRESTADDLRSNRVFQSPWARVMEAVETIAQSHHLLAQRIEQDVENPLRVFQQKKDSMNMTTMANTLSTTAKEYDDAKDKSEKLSKKGGKASTQKVDVATGKLESLSQQWDSQAPYVFETLQALDESRVNQMRDLLTQYQTFESEQAQRTQDRAVETLAQMLDISTESEIQNFVSRVTSGRPRLAPRPSTRQNTGLSATSSAAAPPPPSSSGNDSLTPTVSNQPSQAPLPPTPSSRPEPTSQPSQSSQIPEDDVSEATATPSEPKPGMAGLSMPLCCVGTELTHHRIETAASGNHVRWSAATECYWRGGNVASKDWRFWFWQTRWWARTWGLTKSISEQLAGIKQAEFSG
jgi:hypothetical protein